MTWTRERPKGVDAMRDYQVAHAPNGVRVREWYPADQELQTKDGDFMYRDSWWHPVRADGRYPALPVEDDVIASGANYALAKEERKWVPTLDSDITEGAVWNAYGDGMPLTVDEMTVHSAKKTAEFLGYKYDYVLPYVNGDTRDTLPPLPSDGITQPGDVSADSLGITATPKPLPDGWSHGAPAATPSDELPAPLTPAEEATLRMPFEGDPRDCAFRPPAPEPSRLEIADWQLRAIVAAPYMARYASENDPHGAAAESLRRADALIAAARKGGGA